MTDRPILFNGEMVKAILEGRKTMTRRVNSIGEYYISDKKCPYGVVGDRLWLRETWYYEEHMHDSTEGIPDLPGGLYSHRLVYKADCTDYPVNVGVGRQGWRPSIFMPRWASRITLEITDIKVERLQDITEEDAAKEGINQHPYEYADSTYYDERPEIAGLEANIAAFAGLWDSINGRKPGKAWNDNPWVWVVEFRRVEG
jgi:hypothetical protein